MINIYIDGAFSPKRNIGSYAVLVFAGSEEEPRQVKTGVIRFGTCAKCELHGLLEALKIAADLDQPCKILCDSQYVVKAYNSWIHSWAKRNWIKSNRRPVKHSDIMKKILNFKHLFQRQKKHVQVEWVRGHNGNPRNEMADQYAVQARENVVKKVTNA